MFGSPARFMTTMRTLQAPAGLQALLHQRIGDGVAQSLQLLLHGRAAYSLHTAAAYIVAGPRAQPANGACQACVLR